MFKGHPKGLIAAALANMGERFGYYIMNAVLVLFLCSKFGLSEETSGTIYSFFYAWVFICWLWWEALSPTPYPELQRNDSNRADNHGNGLCAVVYSDFSNEYEYSLVASAYLFCIVYDSFWQWFV